MTSAVRGYIIDDAVTFGSVEYQKKLAAGWFLLAHGENGFCTMAKKEGR